MVDDQDNFKSIDIGIKVSVKKQELAPNDIDDRVKIDLIKLHSEFSKKTYLVVSSILHILKTRHLH